MNDLVASPKLEPNKKQIIAKYLDISKHIPFQSLADQYHVSPVTLQKAFQAWRVSRPPLPKIKTGIIIKNKDKIIEAYTRSNNPLTAHQIADKLGCAECTIQLRLKEWGIPARQYKKVNAQDILNLISKGWSVSDLAKQFDVDKSSIIRIRLQQGIRTSKRVKMTRQDFRRLKYLRIIRGLSIPQIGKILDPWHKKGFTDAVLYNRIKEFKIPQNKISEVTNEELFQILQRMSYQKIPEIALTLELPEYIVTQTINKFKPKQKKFYHHPKIRIYEIADQVRELTQRGISSELITARLKISPVTLFHIRKRFGISTYRVKKYSQAQILQAIEKIRDLRSKAVTVKQIAKVIGMSEAVIFRLIKEYKVPRTNKVFSQPVINKITKMFESGLSPREISRKTQFHAEGIRYILRRKGYDLTITPWAKKYAHKLISKEQDQQIKELYLPPNYWSMFALAKKLYLDKTTIKDRLEKMGIPIRNIEQAREIRKMHTLAKKKSKGLNTSIPYPIL